MTGVPVPDSVVAVIPGAAGASWTWLASLTGGAWHARPISGPAVIVKRAADREVLATQAAASLGVGPMVMAAAEGWLAVEYLPGRPVSTLELGRPPALDALASLLRRLHGSDVMLPEAPLAPMRAAYLAAVPAGRLPAGLLAHAEQADVLESELGRAWPRRVPAHLDVVANLVRTRGGMRLIDFEYAAATDPARELGQVVWEAELDRCGLRRLVRAYDAGAGVAEEATASWAQIAGVTWTLWALTAQDSPGLLQYARRSWERLQSYGADFCH